MHAYNFFILYSKKEFVCDINTYFVRINALIFIILFWIRLIFYAQFIQIFVQIE